MKTPTKLKKTKARQSQFAKDIHDGMQDLIDALESGDGSRFTFNKVRLNLKSKTYHPRTVKEVRELLNASQSVFAAFLGASLRSVCDWEQGRSKPMPSVCRFMDEIRLNPEYFRKRLAESVTVKRLSA